MLIIADGAIAETGWNTVANVFSDMKQETFFIIVVNVLIRVGIVCVLLLQLL